MISGLISPVRRLGIVGHAADKFTLATEIEAQVKIRGLIAHYRPDVVVSGACHLGGVDLWAEIVARELGIPVDIRAPKVRQWGASGGYRDRNLAIANNSDLVAVIVVDDYPSSYGGMRFDGCYHCGTRNPVHVKSGGCWTAWRARRREWVIIPTELTRLTQ